jgi:hypothetical protein
MWVPAIHQAHLGHLNIKLVSLGMPYDFFFLLPTASAAMSFRSVCGSKRSPPANNRQRRLAGTPHVGQGTEFHCFYGQVADFHAEYAAINAVSRLFSLEHFAWARPEE